nr:terminase large subunit [uncultured Mediterranean phage uvMED]|tara:strand:- start:6286 stop:7932 length:1647 start_codon:yes stop_codon:yes gene_type:complete
MSEEYYLGNPLLKKANTRIEFTEEQLSELVKCSTDPVYFTKYIKIVTLDHGLQPFKMYPFQQEMIESFHDNRFNICKLPRQSGKSTTVVSYLLHYAIFNDNVNIAILANKANTARDLLNRLQTGYENLPKWLQQGILSWNKGSLELENGSRIFAASTSASSVRGGTYNIIFLDEFAFVPNQVADNFFSSVYPTITSGKSSKVIVVSTPFGMNHFYRLWSDAQKQKNEYVPLEVHWTDIPGRDEEFKKTTISNTSEAQWRQEFECQFLGSADTLISGPKLNALAFTNPKTSNAGFDLYEEPQKDHTYVVTVDVARGIEKDYSAFIVVDVSQYPHKIVGKYRNNQLRPIFFPQIIKEIATSYNNAYILCEVNDIGDQVAAGLFYDLEYANLLMCAMRGRAGQVLGQGFSGKKVQLGLKMSKTTKKVGCFNLKTLIEDNKLIFEDFDIVNELTTFIQKGNSFEAEEGKNDDLVMCLVIYAWLINEDYFKELTDQDIRKRLYDEQKNQVEQDMSPFGFISDGITDENSFTDESGDRWYTDEYGDMSHMWEYM